MQEEDKRGVLDEEPFIYTADKQGLIFIAWHGRPVMTLRGDKAEKFLTSIAEKSGKEAQLIMAKLTGNFKRGNEKTPGRP